MESVLETQQEDKEGHDREPTELEGSLSDLHVSDPQQRLSDVKAAEACPESYRVNSPKEIQLLAIADNFHRQYLHLYPSRKPLFLCPVNECGIKKFVSTTLRPTPPMIPDLLKWERCTSFVANFLSLEPLEPPVDLPTRLLSPTFVKQHQRATCFEYATLLCSLLRGAQYDAYCVSGYAVREMCLLDHSKEECPVMDAEVKSMTTAQEPQENKYSMKPVEELSSCFLVQQEKKKQEEAELLQKLKEVEERKTEESPPDPLRALRVHCWVLVMSGSQDIQENFFIDPLTGNRYSTDSDKFLGIESIWNDYNYYVNMQDCVKGCTEMEFNLDDLTRWEPVLYGAVTLKQLKLDSLNRKTMLMDTFMSLVKVKKPLVFSMPRSWVSAIHISKEDLHTRWPGGERVIHYRKAVLEKFAPYKWHDGLVTRLTRYKDLDCTEIIKLQMWYKYRLDHLERREINKLDGITTEHFTVGRSDRLIFHRYSRDPDLHEMEFGETHFDGLMRRVESQGEVTETFQGREDHLYYRYAIFGEPVQRPSKSDKSPWELLDSDLDDTPLLKVEERFHRNSSKQANDDVAKRVFLLAERQIEVTYHLEDHLFIPSQTHFSKPAESTLWSRREDFRMDMVSTFQVDPSKKPVLPLTLYRMLLDLMTEENKAVCQIRESKKQVERIIASREQEEAHIKLFCTPWIKAKNREQREQMDHQIPEDKKVLQQRENDILAPFLIQLNNPASLEPDVGRALVRKCFDELKMRLDEYGTLIQGRYDQATKELQLKQQWYQTSQFNMSKEEEEDYKRFCARETLAIDVAKKRLAIHKETATQRAVKLYRRLEQDPRVSEYMKPSCLEMFENSAEDLCQ